MPMLTVQLPPGSALTDALRVLQLAKEDVDTAFGLVAVDPDAGLYAIRVTDDAAARLTTSGNGATIFADPRIEPASGNPAFTQDSRPPRA
ncbi:hypothetical protein [Nocardia transvalensis]|uniref:hypothetical protein n=1 Tax=Nocardia transvalensis TaxID=37333 RepID=UPI00189300A2|nr:hypothetical protein [Nocardia transvalensis]MBF6327332.1 hypothetical protein [Nocardia transvalensis]